MIDDLSYSLFARKLRTAHWLGQHNVLHVQNDHTAMPSKLHGGIFEKDLTLGSCFDTTICAALFSEAQHRCLKAVNHRHVNDLVFLDYPRQIWCHLLVLLTLNATLWMLLLFGKASNTVRRRIEYGVFEETLKVYTSFTMPLSNSGQYSHKVPNIHFAHGDLSDYSGPLPLHGLPLGAKWLKIWNFNYSSWTIIRS